MSVHGQDVSLEAVSAALAEVQIPEYVPADKVLHLTTLQTTTCIISEELFHFVTVLLH